MITEYVELHDISVRRLWDACRKKNGLMLLTLVGLLCNYAKTATASVQMDFRKKSEHMRDFISSVEEQSSNDIQSRLARF